MVHGLSFDIEEHFQVSAFDCAVRRRHWETQESRVERNTQVILDILEERGVTATMFVLGWVAERKKDLVKRIVNSGHELASHARFSVYLMNSYTLLDNNYTRIEGANYL